MSTNDIGSGGGLLDRVAAGPISWGVCEMPGWGLQLPVARVLDEMRQVGFTAIELGAIGWLPTDVDALRETLDQHGLRAVAGFVPVVGHDSDRRDEMRRMAAETARRFAAVGAEHFVTALVNDPDDWSRPVISDDEWDHLVDVVDELDDLVAEHGLRQVVHPHLNTLVETAEELDRFLDASDVPICLDTGHLTLGGADPLEIAEQRADRVGLVHLKDVRADPAARLADGELDLMAAVQAGLFAPLGEGDVPIADVITALERNGYTGLYVLEQDVAITGGEPPPGEGPIRDVATSVAYLRSIDSSLSATLRSGDNDRLTTPSPIT